jgi:hypothetical protein
MVRDTFRKIEDVKEESVRKEKEGLYLKTG